MRSMEAVLRRWVRPVETFARTETFGGTLLVAASATAMIWANSPLRGLYDSLLAMEFSAGSKGFGLTKPLILWINDLLMAIFFLLVGLEIKRELLIGELNTFRKASLPAVAAIGGMVVPAALFLLLARHSPESRGWGVPVATDIAFALGCMRLVGRRVPSGLLVMMTALAVIDDLGAILVIAIFYSRGISLGPLTVAGMLTLALIAMNLFSVRRPVPYLLVGIVLWVAILKSGIHATVAGVVVGLCVPARARLTLKQVRDEVRELFTLAESANEDEAESALELLQQKLKDWESPLSQLERVLHPWVSYGVIPVFALANAGLSLKGFSFADLVAPVSMGTVLGLFVGKQLGVFGATVFAVRMGWAQLPSSVGWSHVYGLATLAGVGFTMSLFVAGLAFGEGTALHEHTKLGVLVGSLLSAVVGIIMLKLATSRQRLSTG